jgi:hypothetical protein
VDLMKAAGGAPAELLLFIDTPRTADTVLGHKAAAFGSAGSIAAEGLCADNLCGLR